MEHVLELLGRFYWAIPLFIVIVFAPFLFRAFLRTLEVRKELQAAATNLSDWDVADGSSDDQLRRFMRAHLIGDEPVRIAGWSAERRLISEELAELFDSYVERRTSILSFRLGPFATALALTCTFLLIAWVLDIDVRHALGSTDDNSAQLARAVGNLGLKFFISASGIAVSALYSVGAGLMRDKLLGAAHAAAERCAPLFCTPVALSAAAQVRLLHEAELARNRDEARANDVRLIKDILHDAKAVSEASRAELVLLAKISRDAEARLAFIQDGIEKLKSIEVSVSNLGTEVTEQLRNMLTRDLGDQMKTMLNEIMGQAEKLSEDLRTKLLDGLEQAMGRELPRVLESLDAIKVSVQGQAESPVERLLEQLRGVVSGGIQSESAQMSAAMKEFATVIPSLANQLRTTAESLTNDMRSRTDESSAASETLMSRMTDLLTKLDSQQTANQEFLAQATEATKSNAMQLVEQIQEGGSSLIEGLFASSRRDIDELLTRLHSAAASNTSSYGSLEQSVSQTGKSISDAGEALRASVESIRAIAGETQKMMVEARQTHELARQASRGFETSAGMLQQGADSMRAAVDGARTHSGEQRELLEQHRKALSELETLWPKLFETYLRSFEQKAIQLKQGWEDFYNKSTQFSKSAAGDLADATEELTTQVEALGVKLKTAKLA